MSSSINKGCRILLLAGGEKSAILQQLLLQQENVIGVILPFSNNRENRYDRLKELCNDKKINILRPKKTDLKDTLRNCRPDILISCGYPHLLTLDLLSIAHMNINVHPTLLPKYRGAATAWHVIANGETESGVTVHLIDEGIDSGDIILQKRIPLTPFETVYSLMRKTSEAEPEVLAEALTVMRKNFAPLKQNEDDASTFTAFRTPEESAIDWNSSLKELYNFIRACDPEKFPAYFYVDNQKVAIKLFRPEKPSHELDSI